MRERERERERECIHIQDWGGGGGESQRDKEREREREQAVVHLLSQVPHIFVLPVARRVTHWVLCRVHHASHFLLCICE